MVSIECSFLLRKKKNRHFYFAINSDDFTFNINVMRWEKWLIQLGLEAFKNQTNDEFQQRIEKFSGKFVANKK